MVIILGFLISFAAGWSIAACDAMFRAEERPGIFRGTAGMVLLLVVAGIGGVTLAGAIVWIFQSLISAVVAVIVAGGIVLGSATSKMLHVNTAGAANRMMLGLAALVILYGLVWTYLPPPAPPTPVSNDTPAVPTPR